MQSKKNLILHKIKDKDAIDSGLLKYVSEKFEEAGIDASGIDKAKIIGNVVESRKVLVSLISSRHKKEIFDIFKNRHGQRKT